MSSFVKFLYDDQNLTDDTVENTKILFNLLIFFLRIISSICLTSVEVEIFVWNCWPPLVPDGWWLYLDWLQIPHLFGLQFEIKSIKQKKMKIQDKD